MKTFTIVAMGHESYGITDSVKARDVQHAIEVFKNNPDMEWVMIVDIFEGDHRSLMPSPCSIFNESEV